MAKLEQYNLDDMTAQEVLEASAIHLFEQSRMSISTDLDDCVYNGPGNICCAAGIFIQGYTPSMEKKTWGALVEDFNQSDKHTKLVRSLQCIHDSGCYSIKLWKNRLTKLAVTEGLDCSFLEEWTYDKNLLKYVKVL
jgi:hypothetical protein